MFFLGNKHLHIMCFWWLNPLCNDLYLHPDFEKRLVFLAPIMYNRM